METKFIYELGNIDANKISDIHFKYILYIGNKC